jgi:hypothetical protein
MVVCIECSTRTKDELDELLRLGQYRDYGEAVALAVSNQLTLQRSTPAARSILLGLPARAQPGPASDQGVRPAIREPGNKPAASSVVSIPDIFRSTELQEPSSDFASMPNDSFTAGQTVPIDRWIFGQHNKLLPLKASVRALAVLLNADSAGVPLSRAASDIAGEAETLGAFLRRVDESHGFIRDEALATAFPSDSADVNKSRLRYANQFVGSINKHGQLRGLPTDLKLVNSRGTREPKLALTEPGWYFAKLQNPILDGSPGATERLSAAERDFLTKHVQTNVPVEDFAIRAVLRALREDASSPEELDRALASYLPPRTERPVSQAFLSTQRAGVISRMGDLGLVERIRDGLRVTYKVSDSGSRYLEQEPILRG